VSSVFLTSVLHIILKEAIEIQRYPKDSSEVAFWQRKLQESGSLLRRYIEELRNHITDTSKRDTFYVYFHWRSLNEKSYYNLKLAITGLFVFENSKDWDPTFSYLVNLLVEEVSKYNLRFKDTKFFEFFNHYLGYIPHAEKFPNGIQLIPIREYLGNFEENPYEILKRVYTLRFNTPRRVKRKVFHRGYDDKGSESSVSERARRSANTVEFPYLTKDFLEILRNHSDPIGLLRDMGYLRE